MIIFNHFPIEQCASRQQRNRSELATGRIRPIGGPDRHYVPSIYAATRATIDIDPHRLSGGAERTAGRGSDSATWAIARDRGRRQWQNAHTHLSRSLLARERDRSAKYLAAHLHE